MLAMSSPSVSRRRHTEPRRIPNKNGSSALSAVNDWKAKPPFTHARDMESPALTSPPLTTLANTPCSGMMHSPIL